MRFRLFKGLVSALLILSIFGFLKKKKNTAAYDQSEILELEKGEKHIVKLNKLVSLIESLEEQKKSLVEGTENSTLHIRREYYNKAKEIFVQLTNFMQHDDLNLEDILDNYYEKNFELRNWMDANERMLGKLCPFFPNAIPEIIFKIQKRMQKVSSDNFIDELANYLLLKGADLSELVQVYQDLSRLNIVSLKNSFEAFIMDQNEEVKIIEAIIDREKNNKNNDPTPEDKQIRDEKIRILTKQQSKIKEVLSKLEMYLAVLEKQNKLINKALQSLQDANFSLGVTQNQEMLSEISHNLSESLNEDEKPFILDLQKDHEILKELNRVFESMEKIEKNN